MAKKILVDQRKIQNKTMLLVLTESNTLSIIGSGYHDHDQDDVMEDLTASIIIEICNRSSDEPMSSVLSSLIEEAWELAAVNDSWFAYYACELD